MDCLQVTSAASLATGDNRPGICRVPAIDVVAIAFMFTDLSKIHCYGSFAEPMNAVCQNKNEFASIYLHRVQINCMYEVILQQMQVDDIRGKMQPS